jgi:hypothetical protein
MHNAGYELPRITIPRTPVNKAKKKGQGFHTPALKTSAITDPRLVNRWVRAPVGVAIPDRALGEVHLAD